MIEKFSGFEQENPLDLYAADRDIATQKGVDDEGKYPYFYKGSKDMGVLLIHGLTASPKEVEPLASILKDRGVTVYTPRVAGHGTKPSDMNTTSYEDWYKSLQYGYFAVKNSCKEVIIAGQSNGGLLATLTTLYNPADKLLLFAPAFKVRTIFFPMVQILHKISGGGIKRFLPADKKGFNYDIFPYEALYQMKGLQDFLWPKLSNIKIPIFLSITKNDILISVKSAIKAVNMTANGQSITTNVYNNRAYDLQHILTEEHVKDSILKEAADWVEGINSSDKKTHLYNK